MPKRGRQGEGGGAPIKTLSEEQISEVGALASVLNLQQIADYLEISRNTLSAICDRQPEVFEQIKKGKAKAIGTVAKGLVRQAMDGNTTAAIFYLKTQAGWQENQKIDLTSSDGSMSKNKELTEEELEEELKKRGINPDMLVEK